MFVVIRPRIPVKPCRSDPVALYHQYQAEWKRRNIPGESSHSDLRWMIRERMLGDTLVCSINYRDIYFFIVVILENIRCFPSKMLKAHSKNTLENRTI